MLNGIDISSWQNGLDAGSIQADFVIAKATQGTWMVQETCDRFITAAQNAGKLTGFYHFAESGNMIDQANYFVDNTLGYYGKSLPILDWEDTAVPLGPSAAKQFLDHVYTRTGIRPIIYMSKSVTRQYDWSEVARDYGLWAAQYPDYNPVYGYQDDPWTDDQGWGAWDAPAIFQYTSSGRLNGWNGPLDLDKFYGDKDAWNRYVTAGATQSQQEDEMAANEIWEYPIGTDATPDKDNMPAWQRLSWINHDTAKLTATLNRTDDAGTGDETDGDIYTRICWIDNRVRTMSIELAAMETAIKALADAKGADADQIAETVKNAVAEKLATIKLEVKTDA